MKVFGLAGWSGSGKTTLLEDLIPRLLYLMGPDSAGVRGQTFEP